MEVLEVCSERFCANTLSSPIRHRAFVDLILNKPEASKVTGSHEDAAAIQIPACTCAIHTGLPLKQMPIIVITVSS
jgi:hypothetical protein